MSSGDDIAVRLLTPVFAIVLTIGAGCTSRPCPPCDAVSAYAGATKDSGGESAPGAYYALPGLEHGLLQSPVNILSDHVEPGKHTIEYHGGDGAEVVTNQGTTVEVGFGQGIATEFDGQVYEFMQLHFHTPAEHLIDGITYPMEMHLVHSRPGPAADDPPDYLVVALLFRMGASNRFLEEFLDVVPRVQGQSAELDGVFLTDVLPPGANASGIHYYHYGGSLTTPPYTESVNWLVAKEVIEAAPLQIQRINFVEGDNARRIQPLYSREIDE